jgi:hypothetical protein
VVNYRRQITVSVLEKRSPRRKIVQRKQIMKPKQPVHLFSSVALLSTMVLFCGCATTDNNSTPPAASNTPNTAAAPNAVAGHFPEKYKADDGRTISIGHCTADNGGWRFKEPHMDKCWIADGFDFKGYDVIYIAPTLSTAKFHDDEVAPHQLLLQRLPEVLAISLQAKGIFAKVVTDDSGIKPGARVLKLENTILEYSKGGGAARYFVGLYGGGQPMFRVHGLMTDGDRTVFDFVARRSGVSGDARMGGAFMKDEDIQLQDIRSLVLDLSDFIAAVAGKYQPL